MEYKFGLKSYAWFQNGTSVQREFNLKSQVWLQTKLHDMKFNCHFIRSILKSHNFVPLNFRFCCIVPLAGSLKIVEPETPLRLIKYAKRCFDENSFEHDKETSSSEVRMKIVYFMHKSSILVVWINDGRPSFLLWLRLRLFVVFGEGINFEGAYPG